jgi:hypothetical protein
MKKIITMVAVGALLCVSGAARADKVRGSRMHSKVHNVLLGLDTEVGIPLGNYADANSVGGGPVLSAEYTLFDTLGATLRIGFQGHVDRTVAGVDSHVHAIPVLLGTKYYIGAEREGMFGAFELGLFDLMSSVTRGAAASVTDSSIKFGMGLGVGYQQDRWSARVNVHSQDVGNFGSAMMITGGIGYHFYSL